MTARTVARAVLYGILIILAIWLFRALAFTFAPA